MKKRIVSVELLRIISMMMVVMLHYFAKGGLLTPILEEFGEKSYVVWFMESFCIVAVNVYMLISGYFLVEAKWRLSRLIELICQVLFYGIGIAALMLLTGLISVGDMDIYRISQYVFPINMEHYWFVTAYVGMYLFAPILAAGVKAMEKKQLQITILLLLGFYSVLKTVMPIQLTVDERGYDAIWFMCVFLVAAYMRLYGVKLWNSVRSGILCYAGIAVLIFALSMLLRQVSLHTGLLKGVVQNAYHYNHVLNLLAAMALFSGFIHWKLPEDGKLSRFICKISPYTLGVYLLHEHIEVRFLWTKWCGADISEAPIMLAVRALVSVLLVFALGILVDMIRGKIFELVKVIWRKFFGKAQE